MPEPPEKKASRKLILFCEDTAHERFLTAVVRRIAREEAVDVQIDTGSARGGHGRVLSELRVFQTLLAAKGGLPDLLIVGIDANCDGLTRARKHIETTIDASLFPTVALAVPDPHVERWFLCDPQALRSATDAHIALPRRKCDRDLYKQMLSSALVEAGNVVTLGGAEFAEEIVAEMDLFRAGKAEPSLRVFLEDVRNAMKRWSETGLGGP